MDLLLFIPHELSSEILTFLVPIEIFALCLTSKQYLHLFLIHLAGKTLCAIKLSAVSNGDTNLFRWIDPSITKTTRQIQITYTNTAASKGSLVILQHLREVGCDWDIMTCFRLAAQNGHLNILKYLYNRCHYWVDLTCCWAAEYGHLHILQYLRANGYRWHIRTCEYASKNGHIDVIKYLRKNGCILTTCSYLAAASNGHLETLRYLHENGCPLDEYACYNAVVNGHLQVLQYLHENGCPWNGDVYYCAVRCGRQDVLQYLQENECPTK